MARGGGAFCRAIGCMGDSPPEGTTFAAPTASADALAALCGVLEAAAAPRGGRRGGMILLLLESLVVVAAFELDALPSCAYNMNVKNTFSRKGINSYVVFLDPKHGSLLHWDPSHQARKT